MTAKLFENNADGAGFQAQAVLAYLRNLNAIEESWSKEEKKYLARPEVARWENCREQGYIVFMRSNDYKRQMNIAFFEHRNSDEICAVVWEQCSMNSITIETAQFGEAYKTKYAVTHSVKYGEAKEIAELIYEDLKRFWIETSNNEKAAA